MNGLTFKYVPKDVFGKMVRELTLGLYPTNTTISDGTILGNVSTDIYGNECFATEYQNYYLFSNIAPNQYKLIKSGAGVLTEVLEDAFDVPYSGKSTGSDIPYKDNSNVSVATKIDSIATSIEAIEEEAATASSITLNDKGNYLTIQAAIDDSVVGDFIRVRKGEYSEHLVVKDGVYLHIEPGATITSPTDTEALYGVNLTDFKLSGGGKFINNGIDSAINIQGDVNQFKALYPSHTIVELNGGKTLIYSSLESNNFCLTEDGINFTSATDYTVPLRLKTIGMDGTDAVYGFVTSDTVGYTAGFYYSLDNGLNWTLNNSGLTLNEAELGKGAYHSGTGRLILGCNDTIYLAETFDGTWTIVSTGLGGETVVLKGATCIGGYVYVCINNSIFRCDITTALEEITWEPFADGIDFPVLSHLESNGIDRIYTWDSVAKKLYQCQVTTTSTWTEIILPASPTTHDAVLQDLIYHNNYLYLNLTVFGILRTWDPPGTTNLYTRYSNWEHFNKGIFLTNFTAAASIHKSGDYFYHYWSTSAPLRYNNGNSWIPIKGGTTIELEFDTAENYGLLDEPNISSPAVLVAYSNLKLKCNGIYSKRNVALQLSALYGTLDAKVGRIETGVPEMTNGESGSTALFCLCDGYFESNEIVVNNVGHAISARGGIMHFKVKKISVTNNHPIYQVQAISQITSQAYVGTTSTIEFNEIYQNRGKYGSTPCVTHSLGYLILKGKNIISTSSEAVSSNGDLQMQVDNVENKSIWTAFSGGSQYPYSQYVKNTSFRSQIYLTVLLLKDMILGGAATTLDNCNFYSKDTSTVGQILLVDAPYVNLTPVAGAINIKGINTFNNYTQPLITFTGEGVISINGSIMNYGKYIYLVGGVGIAGSWRMSATLLGNVVFEYTADGTNWV